VGAAQPEKTFYIKSFYNRTFLPALEPDIKLIKVEMKSAKAGAGLSQSPSQAPAAAERPAPPRALHSPARNFVAYGNVRVFSPTKVHTHTPLSPWGSALPYDSSSSRTATCASSPRPRCTHTHPSRPGVALSSTIPLRRVRQRARLLPDQGAHTHTPLALG
jgi:hypothetical protein